TRSILPALSKILETVVKTDFEIHLAKTEALPNTQFGFRRAARPQLRWPLPMQRGLKAEREGRL
ncbi:Hypothetical protein FKW44_011971, partial [Caligus rogercresseyi]